MDDLDGLIEELEAGNCLVEEEASLWAVVEFNQASFWPEEDAYAAAVDRARDTAIIGPPGDVPGGPSHLRHRLRRGARGLARLRR